MNSSIYLNKAQRQERSRHRQEVDAVLGYDEERAYEASLPSLDQVLDGFEGGTMLPLHMGTYPYCPPSLGEVQGNIESVTMPPVDGNNDWVDKFKYTTFLNQKTEDLGDFPYTGFDGVDNFCQPMNPPRWLGSGAFGTVDEVVYFRHSDKCARKALTKKARDGSVYTNFVTEVENYEVLRELNPTQHMVKFLYAYTTPYETRIPMPKKNSRYDFSNEESSQPAKSPYKNRSMVPQFYLVMHPVASNGSLGGYLKELEQQGGGLTRDQTSILRKAIGCLTVGLASLHEKNLFHGDLHSDNVLMNNGEVLYSDFGSAIMAHVTSQSGTPEGRLWIEDNIPPEVLNGTQQYSAKSDNFGLGRILLKLFCAATPGVDRNQIEEGKFITLNSSGNLEPKMGLTDAQLIIGFMIQSLLIRSPRERWGSQKAKHWVIQVQKQDYHNWMCDSCWRQVSS